MAIETRFTTSFGCAHPIQQAGMGGVSSPDLAIAVSNAGGMGMLTGTVGAEALSAHLDAAPANSTIGINFLMPFLDRNTVEITAAKSPLVGFFWSDPDADLIADVHAGGARLG